MAAYLGPFRPVDERTMADDLRGLPESDSGLSVSRASCNLTRHALGLVPEDRELIESAALVANVGYLINFKGHHKHSYHLIRNSELPGFDNGEPSGW